MNDIRPMTELEIKMMGQLYQLRHELTEAKNECERLRTNLELAPHNRSCPGNNYKLADELSEENCTCWKKTALESRL